MVGDEVVIIPKKEGGGPAATLAYLKGFSRNFDVVHVQGLQYFEPLVSALLARRLGGPAPVATAHGFGGESKWWRNGAEREVMKHVVRNFDVVVSISEYVKKRLQKFTDLPTSRIVTVYNGVDTSAFDPTIDGTDFKHRIGLTGSPVILYVGRLAWNKGLPHLVDSMREVVENFPRAQLLLCGRGKLESELRHQADSLGLQDNVRFAGLVPDESLPSCYAACDVFVLPSSLEPFGLVLLEAMSMCKPVVATNVGGIPEVVEDGSNGLLVAPQDSESLSQGLLRILSDESLRTRLAKNGRATVESRFTLDRMARTTHNCYLRSVAPLMPQ
jgi:glycosyltransferase involved in cell wall biosynthesis